MKKIDVPPLFGRTSTLIHQIDDFLDQVSERALVFEEGVGIFTERGVGDSCEAKLQHLHDALMAQTEAWKKKPATKFNKAFNKKLEAQIGYLYSTFHQEMEL